MKGDIQHFKPVFKGCVVVPLTDDDDDIKRIKYYGDWANKRTHARIMRKPRRYQLTFYFKGFDGERGMEQIQILDKDNFLELSAYIGWSMDKLPKTALKPSIKPWRTHRTHRITS